MSHSQQKGPSRGKTNFFLLISFQSVSGTPNWRRGVDHSVCLLVGLSVSRSVTLYVCWSGCQLVCLSVCRSSFKNKGVNISLVFEKVVVVYLTLILSRSDSKHTSASRKILAQVQEASKRMAAELEAKHANSKVCWTDNVPASVTCPRYKKNGDHHPWSQQLEDKNPSVKNLWPYFLLTIRKCRFKEQRTKFAHFVCITFAQYCIDYPPCDCLFIVILLVKFFLYL